MPLCFLSLEWEETDETPGETQLAYDFIKNHLPTACCQAQASQAHRFVSRLHIVLHSCNVYGSFRAKGSYIKRK